MGNLYNNTIAASVWFQGFNDVLMANSILVQASAVSQKQAYDNWQIAAKTQLSILDKQNKLVYDRAKIQDTAFKQWEDYVSAPVK